MGGILKTRLSPTASLVTQTLANAFTIDSCSVMLLFDFIHSSIIIYFPALAAWAEDWSWIISVFFFSIFSCVSLIWPSNLVLCAVLGLATISKDHM